MAKILLLGSNTALLEGLSQTLASAGHTGIFARTISEAVDVAAGERPLVAVLERSAAMGDAFRLPLEAGGAIVVYSTDHSFSEPLPAAVARATLAELVLPLERQRLLALVQRVVERSAATGRGVRATPTDQPAIIS